MLFSSALLTLASIVTIGVHASPVAPRDNASPAAPRNNLVEALQADDVVVMGKDGTPTVMKDYDYTNLMVRFESEEKKALRDLDLKPTKTMYRNPHYNPNKKREDCEQSQSIQVLSDTEFINWDVPMSAIVSAAQGTTTITVADGYTIGNSVTTGASVGTGLEGVLSTSFKIDWEESWTSSTTMTYAFVVPAQQYGIVVSQPNVRRIQGNFLHGCTDNPTVDSFMADAYRSKSYNGIGWPEGIIRLCNSTEYPIPYCNGDGVHK